MEIARKLAILADAAKYDASCASSGSRGRRATREGGLGSTEGMGICHSYTPDGRCVSLLKLLLTNYCIYDCQYCVNRRTSSTPRARFTEDEVVGLTLDFYRRNYIEGLFLSSGIARSPDDTMERLVRVARTLRERHDFQGYIHLKTIPHASPALVAEAGRWADRLSVNVELPTQQALDQLAPEKELVTIRRAMGTIRTHADAAKAEARPGTRPAFAPAGQSTQLIVGATSATDATILDAATTLYQAHRLRRVYYSAFSPIPDAPAALPSVAPPLVREHRLYQADWLVRFYGFKASELTTPEQPDLDLQLDPKTAWAIRHRHLFPVDVNRAPRELLLRVPGFGARSVERILATRRVRRLRLEDLKTLGAVLRRAAPFVTAADPASPARGGVATATAGSGATSRLVRPLDVHALDAADLRARLVAASVGKRAQLDLFGGAPGDAPARPPVEAALAGTAVPAGASARSVLFGEL